MSSCACFGGRHCGACVHHPWTRPIVCAPTRGKQQNVLKMKKRPKRRKKHSKSHNITPVCVMAITQRNAVANVYKSHLRAVRPPLRERETTPATPAFCWSSEQRRPMCFTANLKIGRETTTLEKTLDLVGWVQRKGGSANLARLRLPCRILRSVKHRDHLLCHGRRHGGGCATAGGPLEGSALRRLGL